MAISRRQFLAATPVVALGTGAVTGLAQSGSWLKGIDVSSTQGVVNWAAVKAGGSTFACCKATEGLTNTDARFALNWPAMKAAGLIRGASHAGRPGCDPVAQADRFADVVQPKPGDLQLVLDLQTTDGKTKAQVASWTQAFVNRVRARTGRSAILYTGHYFWRDSVSSSNNLNCPLWLAAYSSSTSGLIPAAWSTWSFWQYTATASAPGVTGTVDRDYFNGSLTQLRALTLA